MSPAGPRVNLASDWLLPQRDILLDAGMVARLLSSQLGARGPLAIDSCRLLRTKYRFGDSLRVLHRIRVGGSDFDVAARTFTEGRSQRAYERALAAAVACEPLRPVIHSAEIGTVFWTFPNDRKLLGLQALKTIPHELAQLFVPAWRYSRVVAYAPEKCATAQCMDEDSNVLAYAKVYQGDEGERIYANYKALRRSLSPDTSAFCLPRAIAYSETHRMLLLETVEGERLVDVLGPRGPGRGYKHLGAALAALHSLPVPSGLRSFKRLDVGRIGRAAQIIAQARPDVWGEAFYLADELALRWEPPAGPPVCLHGDVHPKNVILRNDRLTLIDLDQSAAGSPAADLGSLLASLAYSRLSGLLSEARARELGDAFLNGYAARRALPSAACLGWHTSAALLAERALRAVNRIRPQGLAHLRRLLVEATRILRSGGKR